MSLSEKVTFYADTTSYSQHCNHNTNYDVKSLYVFDFRIQPGSSRTTLSKIYEG